jgi:hypothetical protein
MRIQSIEKITLLVPLINSLSFMVSTNSMLINANSNYYSIALIWKYSVSDNA